MILDKPRLMIASLQKGEGKTLTTLALASLLRTRGFSVSCATTSSSLPQTTVLSRLVQRYVHALDPNLLSLERRLFGLELSSLGSELLIVDGHDGLFDTLGQDIQGSDAELAIASNTPVILVVDASRWGQSIGAVVRACIDLPQKFNVNLVGVIINRIDADSGFSISYFNKSMETFGLAPTLGAIADGELYRLLPDDSLEEIKRENSGLPRDFYLALSRSGLHIDQITTLAAGAIPTEVTRYALNPVRSRVRIAVADDPCFSLTYRDNLDLMRFSGATLVAFSPVADLELPSDIGALYIGGGYVLDYGSELARNENLKREIKEFAEKGGIIYSEGGGTAYLCETFGQDEGENYAGVGIIKAHAVYKKSPSAFTSGSSEMTLLRYQEIYQMIQLDQDTVIGPAGERILSVHPDNWSFAEPPEVVFLASSIAKSGKVTQSGFATSGTQLSFLNFLHWASNPNVPFAFVNAATDSLVRT